MGIRNSMTDAKKVNDLAGSEKAVVRLSEEFAKLGHQVIVVGPTPTMQHNGVTYLHFTVPIIHNLTINSDLMIIWTVIGLQFYQRFQQHFIATKTVCDIHNVVHFPNNMPLIKSQRQIFVKSRHHYNHIKQIANNPTTKFQIIPNGLEIPLIDTLITNLKQQGIQRQKYRICHASSMDRGVMEMIANSWPIIYQQIPEAEFHVYYGRLNYMPADKRAVVEKLLKTPGVIYHGRCELEDLFKELLSSRIYLYLANNNNNESDCLSIREANYFGCLPITFDFEVFSERPGLKLPPGDYKAAAHRVIELLRSDDDLSLLTTKVNELDWQSVAAHWMKALN